MGRSLVNAINALNEVSNSLDLPEHVGRDALGVYRQLLGKRLTSGRKRDILIGACVYLSCKEHDYPLNLKILCEVCECSKKELIRNKKFIKKFVETNEQLISTESYVRNYSNQLSLKPLEVTKAIRLAKSISKESNSNNNVIATTATYLAARDKVSFRELSGISGLSTSIIHKSVKEFKTTKPLSDSLIRESKLLMLRRKKK